MEMIYKFMQDPEVTKYEDWIQHKNIDYTRGFISWLTSNYQSEQTYCWGITLDEEMIGFALIAFEYYTSKNEWHDCDFYAITKKQFLREE
jgi:RimJ/RimL family protein N-acetyltransferase